MSSVPEHVSVVIPVHNEAGNVVPLAREIHAALGFRGAPEIIFVDDGSTDGTAAAVRAAAAEITGVRLLRHSHRGGQSAALRTGVQRAHGEWIGTLDGDGQNDPADFPAMLEALQTALRAGREVRLVMGDRVTRCDSWLRKVSSRIANGVRARLLGDGTPDTGCGIKLVHRDTFLELPAFDHMHRFLPALYQRHGADVMSVPVGHRPRHHGQSKYALHDRLWAGIVDVFGVMWLRARYRAGLRVTEEMAPPSWRSVP